MAPSSGEALLRFNWDEAQLLGFELALDHFLQTNGSQDTLWSRLRSQLLVLPREYPFPLTHILLSGRSVTHQHFLAILRDAMAEMIPISSADLQTNIPDHADPAILSIIVDPTFAPS